MVSVNEVQSTLNRLKVEEKTIETQLMSALVSQAQIDQHVEKGTVEEVKEDDIKIGDTNNVAVLQTNLTTIRSQITATEARLVEARDEETRLKEQKVEAKKKKEIKEKEKLEKQELDVQKLDDKKKAEALKRKRTAEKTQEMKQWLGHIIQESVKSKL